MKHVTSHEVSLPLYRVNESFLGWERLLHHLKQMEG